MGDSDIVFRWWGADTVFSRMNVLAKSTTVYISDVKTGEDYFQPIESTMGSTTKDWGSEAGCCWGLMMG
jgi:hypothetical protein